MIRYSGIVLVLFGVLGWLQAQTLNIQLKPKASFGQPALQSFAWAKSGNAILLLGGRIDGLHRRQPFASFDAGGRPASIWVIDPVAQQSWSTSLSVLPARLREQLQSTNMQFIQRNNTLWLMGGYGFSETAQDHITFPLLTEINDVAGLIAAIQQGGDISTFFRFSEDERMAVTGGHAAFLSNQFMIVGGHRFEGRYNPMNGPSFTQTYTNALRQFIVDYADDLPIVSNYSEWIDPAKFHRRDYNLVGQILPSGAPAYTIYSGVFRTDLDLPYLNAITITEEESFEEPDFLQYLNHYHCAVMPVYVQSEQQMHTVFFGGMAQYSRDASGLLVQDNNVPFVNAITDVQRSNNGQLSEIPLPINMSRLKGAGAEFIPASGLTIQHDEVIVLSGNETDSLLLGYIVGGIDSDAPNIFWVNDGSQSRADDGIIEVWYYPENPLNALTFSPVFQLRAYPCPVNDHLFVEFNLETSGDVELFLYSSTGKEVAKKKLRNQFSGNLKTEFEFRKGLNPGLYLLKVESAGVKSTMRILVSE
jgi:hypothetical protein